MKKTVITMALIMFVASSTAINIVDVDFTPETPSTNDIPDINVTVDGQGTSTEKVRYDIVENGTEVVENELTTLDSGTTTGISYWIDLDTYTLENNTRYEYEVVAVDKKEDTDRFRAIIDTDNNTVELEDIEVDERLGDKVVFGLTVINWFMIFVVVLFMYFILLKD